MKIFQAQPTAERPTAPSNVAYGSDPVFQRYSRQDRSCSVSGPTHVLGTGLKGANSGLCRRSPNAIYGIFRWEPLNGHSGLMFAALMIGHHFSISALCKAPSACGVC